MALASAPNMGDSCLCRKCGKAARLARPEVKRSYESRALFARAVGLQHHRGNDEHDRGGCGQRSG